MANIRQGAPVYVYNIVYIHKCRHSATMRRTYRREKKTLNYVIINYSLISKYRGTQTNASAAVDQTAAVDLAVSIRVVQSNVVIYTRPVAIAIKIRCAKNAATYAVLHL